MPRSGLCPNIWRGCARRVKRLLALTGAAEDSRKPQGRRCFASPEVPSDLDTLIFRLLTNAPPARHAGLAKCRRAAATVAATSASPCAAETNPASNADGAK